MAITKDDQSQNQRDVISHKIEIYIDSTPLLHQVIKVFFCVLYRQKYTKNIPKIYQKYTQELPKDYQRTTKGLPKDKK